MRLLSDATAALSESTDCGVSLTKLARSLIPTLGDGCVIHLVECGDMQMVAVAAADPTREGVLREMRRSFPIGGDGAHARVARSGRTERLAEATDPALASVVRDANDSEVLRALGARSAIVVPLKVRAQSLGVITLAFSGRAYDERDEELVEAVASRAALAVEHARLHRDAEAQRARLRIIADTSRALAAELDVDGVARSISRVMQCGVLVALTAADGSFVVRSCTSIDEHVERQLQPLIGTALGLQPGTISDEVLRRGKPQVLGVTGVERLRPPFSTLAGELGLGSLIVAPLIVQGRAIGIMSAFRGVEFEALGREDLNLVSEIADRAAVAFERARLFEGQLRATERLRLLADAGTLLAQSLEVDPTLTTLARLAVQWLSHVCTVDLLEEGLVTSVAVAAADPPLEAATRRAVDQYQGTRCAPPALRGPVESGSPALIQDVSRVVLREFAVSEEHLDALMQLGLRSIIIVPLTARGRPVGVLSLARTRGDAYDGDDLAMAEELGRRAALAVDNAHLFKRATEAIAVRDEFLSIASHELNTPLTPLKMHLDTLRRGKFSPERTAEKLDGASRQVTRLAKLVSELLDVSRITGGRLNIQPERFDLAALVDEIIDRMSDEAQRVGSSLSLRAERPRVGTWDRMRLDEVLTNLLTNAIKYGGGNPIDVELAAHGAGVRIAVRDHGIGIAPEHQQRIFERFERAASARHYGGFGLGLWIARQIVSASGGTIAVESAPGVGSTFIVDLPVGPRTP